MDCTQCGETIKTDIRKTTRFCSIACRRESTKRRAFIVCEICGTAAEIPAYLAHGERQRRFCSQACSGKAKQGHPTYRADPTEERICLACGKGFIVGGRGRPHKRVRFCSLDCANDARYRRSESHCKPMTVTEAAWLAGFMDGEGSILLISRNGGEGVHLRLNIANTHMPSLQYIETITGIGHIYAHKTRVSPRHKEAYSWRCHAEGAEEVLRALQPYLVTKQAQCILGLDVATKLRIPALKADLLWQTEARAAMKLLNQRGPAAIEA